jgi:hypothetical protein
MNEDAIQTCMDAFPIVAHLQLGKLGCNSLITYMMYKLPCKSTGWLSFKLILAVDGEQHDQRFGTYSLYLKRILNTF